MFYNGSMHFGYNGIDWSINASKTDKYFVRADPTTRSISSFSTESKQAALEIQDVFQGELLYVFYSGGVDGEAVLDAFYRAKVPVVAVVLNYHGLNSHEVQYVRSFVKPRSDLITLREVDFNLTSWLQSRESKEVAIQAQTTQLGHTPIFKTALDLCRDGVCITGADQPQMARIDLPGGPKFIIEFEEKRYCYAKFFQRSQLHAVPVFYQWSVELMCSYMLMSGHVGFYNNLFHPSISQNDHFKYGYYKRDLNLAPRKKYTGFERVAGILQDENRAYRETLPYLWDQMVEIEVFDWFKSCGVST